MHTGWYQLAYERDLKPGLNALTLAGRHLLVIYRAHKAEVYDGACPHRGYLLGTGAQLHDDRVVCPFHGQAVGLGTGSHCALTLARHAALLVGGLLFVRIGANETSDAGFAERIAALDASCYIVPGFCRRIHAPAELIIENAFDCAHFQPVHSIGNMPSMETRRDRAGAYIATARFALPPSAWQGSEPTSVPFTATAFSPTLVITELGGARPYLMLSATIPLDADSCELRLSVLVPGDASGLAPKADGLRYLLRQAEAGIDKDILIWEHLAARGAIAQAAPFDQPVLGFQRFCSEFQ